MSRKPRDVWRVADRYSIGEAAYLAAGVDPGEFYLTDDESIDIKAFKSAFGRAAMADAENPQVRLQTFDDLVEGTCADENKTLLNVEWIRKFLSSKGVQEGFFFPQVDYGEEKFRDRNHDHYSPDLDLAVAVWRALEKERTFVYGPKQAILQWIDDHPEAWHGSEPLTAKAKERIAILVNWRKEGGANKTPG